MFWGLILKPQKLYSQVVRSPFQLTMATLDVQNCKGNDVVTVSMTHEGSQPYILCHLRKAQVDQVHLDLSFSEGEKIAFSVSGNGTVHLSGYVLLDDDKNVSDDEDELGEEELKKALKGLTEYNKKNPKNENKKKVKEEDKDDDEDDSDDSDFDLSKSLGDEFDETVEDNDDSDEDGEEEEDDDNEDEEEDEGDESDEEEQQPKAKQMKLDNGETVSKQQKKKDKKNKQNQNEQKEKPQQQQKSQQNQQKGEKKLQGGVRIEDIQVGNGPEAKHGKKVQVYYEGRLKSNNKVFDKSTEGKGFKFALGKNQVIKGWEVGVPGMKVGGKRRIVIPPHLAYGSKGQPPVIPPNSTLIFDVELKSVLN